MSNKAKLLKILDQYRMAEFSIHAMSDFYHAMADAIDKLPDDIGEEDTKQLAKSIHETINNVNHTIENGVIVTTVVGDLTETVAYVGKLGIQQYNAEKSFCEMDNRVQRQFDDLVFTGKLGDKDDPGA